MLAAMEGTVGLMGRLLYGTGMRLLEVLRLRVKDIDFERGQTGVSASRGSGQKVVRRRTVSRRKASSVSG